MTARKERCEGCLLLFQCGVCDCRKSFFSQYYFPTYMHLYDFHLLWQLCRIWTPIRQKNTFTNSREKARGRSIWFVPICKIHYSYLSVFSTRPECFTFSSGPPIRVPPSPPPTDEKMPFSIRVISLKRWMQILQLTKIMALKTEHSEIGLGSISSRCSVM